jgi:hypothetical protein
MTTRAIAMALVAALVLMSGAAFAADTKDKSQPAAASPATQGSAPQKLEGEVVAIDMAGGMMTIRGSDGQTHQFKGTPETLREYKVGDHIQLNLRQQPAR